MTTKTPEERAQELSRATGIPHDFEVLYEQHVTDCKRAEQLLHRKLTQYRSTAKEFFQIPLKAAIKALEDVADEIGRVNIVETAPRILPADDVLPTQTEVSVMSPRQRRKASAKKAVVTFEDHASYTDAIRRPILYDLRNRVFDLDGQVRQTEQCTPGQRIAYNVPGFKIFH
jgi:hypothetical protein